MERKILDKIKEGLARAPRSVDKWHVSDLLYPRKAYFGRIDPQPMTDRQALYFLAGRAHHGILEYCLGPKKEKEDGRADSGEFQRHGIYYSPDLRMPYPWEIKSTRSQYEPKKGQEAERYKDYLRQLHMYQAFDEQDNGGLLLFYLGLKQGRRYLPEIRFYKVQLDKKERAKIVKDSKKLAADLSNVVKTKDHSGLPLCPSYQCGDCPWLKKCEPWKQDPKRKDLQEAA